MNLWMNEVDLLLFSRSWMELIDESSWSELIVGGLGAAASRRQPAHKEDEPAAEIN